MNNITLKQYNTEVDKCRSIFEKKVLDYGTSWRVLRPSSLTDQLFIKAQRIRTLEEGVEQKIDEGIEDEFRALYNYCIIGLVQLKLGYKDESNMKGVDALKLYDGFMEGTRKLMIAKNNDYGEAWRDMRTTSMTDLIMMKIMRIKQIEDNEGETLISEGIDSHYRDIMNYSIFALIKMNNN